MDILPIDLLYHILSSLSRTELTRFMRVAQRYYLNGRKILYANLRINMFPPQIRTAKLMRSLQGDIGHNGLSTVVPSRFVHHLTVTGTALASVAQQSSLRQALKQMSSLLSLDIAIRTFPNSIAGEVFEHECCRSQAFLPELLALKTDDAEVAMRLVPGRAVYSVFVEDMVPAALCCSFLDALANSRCAITQLQVNLEVADNNRAVEAFKSVAERFGQVSMLCIELSVVNPSEKPLSWTSLKVSVWQNISVRPCIYAEVGYVTTDGSCLELVARSA